ncbi:putative n-twist [Operophtera brumata]|uniref:Putative n-twist n=1 Tax=Operophtera brumata TaxID=104452 RepID=A0A0L7L612_OPEBR|nr:putative n-twist [Operophtera brumata]
MSYGTEPPHVWSSSTGEVSPYGPLWDAPPAPVPYPDILAFPPSDLAISVVYASLECACHHTPEKISQCFEVVKGVKEYLK